MDLFMPAERVLYNRSYYFSDEAVDDYNEYIADRDGVNIDVVSSLDFFMNEVWKEIDYAIDNDLSDEISCFDRMLRDLKCGGDPEHPTEISVVAKGTVERWDEPSRGLVVADSLHVSPAAISQAVRYGSPVNGLHFYHGDEPKPAPEFFKPAKGKGGKSPAAIAAAAKAAAGNSAPGTDYREHGIQRDRRAVQ